MKSGEILSSVRKTAFGLSMGSLWQHIGVELRESPSTSRSHKDVFVEILRVLLKEGAVSLALRGQYLEGSMDEQVDQLLGAWPSNPSPDDLDGFGLWFLTEAPAGLVWHSPDGVDVWA
jgi:hypothetical protein